MADDAKLALYSGPEIVEALRFTFSNSVFEAAVRVLNARDSRIEQLEARLATALADVDAANARARSEVEAVLAEVDALRMKYETLRDEQRGLREEDEEMKHLVEVATPGPVRQDEPRVEEDEDGEVKSTACTIYLSSDEDDDEKSAEMPCKEEENTDEDEEDTEPLSQRQKRLRLGESVAVELGKRDGQEQINPVCSLGNDQKGMEPRNGQMVNMSEDSKVAAFVQGRGVVDKISSASKLDEGAKLAVEGASSAEPRVASSLPLVTSNYSGAELMNSDCNDAKLCNFSVEKSFVGPRASCTPLMGLIEPKSERNPQPSTIPSEGHMLTSVLKDVEFCMQAVCALHRQRRLTTENLVLSKSQACRAAKLVEFLLDGDLQGPLIRTAQDLEKQDATGVDLLKDVAMNCSWMLFDIYRSKEDPFFCGQ